MKKTTQKKISFISNLLTYSIGGIGAKFIILFLFPIYSFYLTVEELGFYDLVMMACFIFTPLATLQIGEAAYKFMLEGKYDISKIVINVYTFCFFSFGILALITYATLHFLSVEYKIEIIILFIATAGFQVIRNLARGIGSSRCYAISGVTFSLVIISLNALCLFVLNLGLYSVIISAIIATLVSAYIVLLRNSLLRILRPTLIDISIIKKLLIFSFPLVPNHLSWWAINASNRFIITMILGVASNGIFALATKVAAIMFALNSFFSLAWQDQVLMKANENKKTIIDYKSALSNLIVIQLLLVVSLSYITKPLFDYLIHSEYQDSARLVPLLCISALLSSISSFYGAIMLKLDKTKDIFRTSFYAGIISIAFVYILVSELGLIGAALGIIVGFFSMSIYRGYLLRKLVKTPNVTVWLSVLTLCLLLIVNYYQNEILKLTLLIATFCYAGWHFKLEIINLLKKVRGI